MSWEATMPTTPGCHAREPSTMTLSRSGSKELWSIWTASVLMASSSSCRLRLCESSIWASWTARLLSMVSSNSRASMGESMRPAALMRGPIRKPTCAAFRNPAWLAASEGRMPAISVRVFSPVWRLWASLPRPWRTRIRFSSTRGTMSATVATATRSR